MTQNKVLPGAYINFVSRPRAMGSLGERGVVCVGMELDWGREGMTDIAAAEGKRDKWAVLCMLSVVVPDLTDKALRESYGADSGEAALQEMLYPGEYMRLLEAVKDINGFQSRRRVWKEQAKK